MSELDKLRWRCRRGTLELDLILIRYLEDCYLIADKIEKQAFLQLLGLEDGELIRFLLAEQSPEDDNLFRLVRKIRQLS